MSYDVKIESFYQQYAVTVEAADNHYDVRIELPTPAEVQNFYNQILESKEDAEAAAATATTQAGIATTQAGIATTQAGVATTQAGIATTQAGTATTQAGISTTQAGISTNQAGIATAQAVIATTQAGIATTQANTATTKASEASQSAASALSSKQSAETSATTATTQAGIATTKASEASQSAANALSSSQSASSSANTATTQAGIATTQAGIATTKAAEALQSANNADQSEANALSSANTATTQAGIATNQANIATNKAGEASQSATNASQHEQNASISAQSATTQAGIATTQAGIATTQAGNALTSANNALNSANAAAASAASAAQVGTSTLLTGFTTGANTAIAGTDTILGAFQKAQGQINARVSGTGVSGQVAFWSGTGTQTGDNGLFWDNTNKRLGIGTNVPSQRFSVFGATTTIPNNSTWVTAGNPISSFYGEGASGNMDFFIGGASNIFNARPVLIGRKSAGTLGTPTAVVNGDSIFSFLSSAYSGTQFLNNASINMIVDGTVNTTTVPQAITFETGTTSRTERLRINSNGNVLINTTTDAGFRLDVNGTARVQGALTVSTGGASITGLSTIQGTTASDSGQLGAELLTTGSSDASWTGTSFATGYTHVPGAVTPLTSTLAGIVNTFYQITYTVTGRTAGSFTVAFGGQSFAGLTATGAVGPMATTTGTLVITPTTDFNGTIVLSIRAINPSSASVTFNNSSNISSIELRASAVALNTFIGANSGRRNTTGSSGTFFGWNAGPNNTTGINNTFLGRDAGFTNSIGSENTFVGAGAGNANVGGSNNTFIGRVSGLVNTTGTGNTFVGLGAGQSNTTGGGNSFFGTSSGFNNTTEFNNSYFGVNAGLNISSGTGNVAFGTNSARWIADGTTSLTTINSCVILGANARANANGENNQIVIGHTAIGLGSNTTVIGNSLTTFGRWWGRLLLGTSTDAGFGLDVNGTARVQGALTTNLTAGRVPFIGTGGVLSDSANFIFGDGGRLTINRSTDSRVILQDNGVTIGQISATPTSFRFSTDFTGVASLDFWTAGVQRWSILPLSGVFQSNGAQTIQTTTGNLTISTAGGNGNIILNPNGTGVISITDAKNFSFGTTAGTRLGTATNQLISFWNKTPIVQPTTGIAAATRVHNASTTIHTGDTFGGYTVQQIAQALINIGILA